MRAANVKWSGLELSDVNEMAFTEAESVTYELRPGDLLLGEASGSPSEVGKPGQYKGEIDGCCFQNTLLRVRLPDGLRPPGDTPAPVRFLPMWDSLLLAYHDRSRVIPEIHRRTVIRVNGDFLPTSLVDGRVAGLWRAGAGDGRSRCRARPCA